MEKVLIDMVERIREIEPPSLDNSNALGEELTQDILEYSMLLIILHVQTM